MENLAQHWTTIQATLFPLLERELGPFMEKHQQLVTTLEFARVEDFIRTFWGCVGRPVQDRASLARAFIAKAVYNFPRTSHLLDRLQCDPILRRMCGWVTKSSIPSEATFSRAFTEFAESGLADRAHEAFILKYHSGRLMGHISRDATEIDGREKVAMKAKPEASTENDTGR